MSAGDFYEGREQTLVKHFILRQYLSRFAHIVGSKWDSLTYADCFSGPWNVRDEQMTDSSFAIALAELRNARDTHRKRGRVVALRCFFLEKDPVAYTRLRTFADAVTDATVETRNAPLEGSVAQILDFVHRGGATTFPFIFIDPTGWSGFEMDTIAPLLRLDPGEVLINFMTGHVRRFLDSPQEPTRQSFERLFGSDRAYTVVRGLVGQDRDDAVVQEYAASVKEVGGFKYSCSAIVLHPEIDRTHFHLIYATRNRKGVEVFKEAEKKAMALQESKRADVHGRRRLGATQQPSFLTAEEMQNPAYYQGLRDRYLRDSKARVARMLEIRGRVGYDEVWDVALSQPMTWESDLKDWIYGWQDEGKLTIEGMRDRQRVPHLNEGNELRWIQAVL